MPITSLRHRLLKPAAAVAAIVLAGSLAACGGDDAAAAGDHPQWSDLTITIAEQSDGIKTLVKESGAFEDASYDIKFAKFEYGPPLVEAAANGDVDLGMVGAVPPLNGVASGQRIKIVALQRPKDPEKPSDNIIVPEGSPITSLEDLRGKRIAVPQGSSAHGLALNAIRSVGLTPDDVELVYLPPKEGAAAFQSGKVDAWSIWQPLVGLAQKEGARIIAEGKPPLYPGTLYYVASEKSLQDETRRAAVTDALERIAEAYAFGNENRDEHVKAISIDSGLPEEEVEPIIEGWEYTFEHVDAENLRLYQELADAFVAAGEIPQPVDVTTVVDNLLPENFGKE